MTEPVSLHNEAGEFSVRAFLIAQGAHVDTHLSIQFGQISSTEAIPVRINSACVTSEALGDSRCDCAWQLQQTLRRVVELEGGIITYHPDQEGRELGLFRKIQSYDLMDRKHLSTADAFSALGEDPDPRDYGPSVEMLRYLGVQSTLLLSNNPAKVEALREAGIQVTAVEGVVGDHNHAWHSYLASKVRDFGHTISVGVLSGRSSEASADTVTRSMDAN